MKKVISLLLCLLMCCSFTITASASTVPSYGIVQPYYELANSAESVLSIEGTTATCRSSVRGDTDVIKIVAVQTLEKQGLFWKWSTYKDTTWTKTVYTYSLDMSNTKTDLASGKYRLKTDFTLTDKYGKVETITVYSDEVSI